MTVTSLCQVLGGYPPNGYFLTGLPSDLRNLYQQAYTAGARIHSNSWGSAAAGDYTLDSANTDSFVWTNRDMTITFSAGNEGADANNNGMVDTADYIIWRTALDRGPAAAAAMAAFVPEPNALLIVLSGFLTMVCRTVH